MLRTYPIGIAVVLLAGSVGAGAATAQEPIVVSQAEAQEHLMKGVGPKYPPTAEFARIQGLVVIKIRISKDGSVTETNALSGHPLLVGAAVDAVKKWKYKPFVSDGNPVEVTTTAEVPFWLGGALSSAREEKATIAHYFEQDEECHDLFKAQEYQKAEAPCRAAVDLAEKLAAAPALKRIDSYEVLGYTLFDLRKLPESLEYFKRELPLAEKTLRSDDAELGRAYHALGLGLYANGDLKGAREYYGRSIKTLELARAHARSGRLKVGTANTMKIVLQEYAKLLRQSGDEAAALDAEKRAKSVK